jgi:hypothetical protein
MPMPLGDHARESGDCMSRRAERTVVDLPFGLAGILRSGLR